MSEHPTGAACAAHPNAPAVAVCDRCGAYMCEACTDGGLARSCPSCRARTGVLAFPLRRDRWDLDTLFRLAWRGFARNLGPLVIGTLVLVGVYIVVVYIPQMYLLLTHHDPMAIMPVVLSLVVVAAVILAGLVPGFLAMALDALEGRKVGMGAVFGQVGKVWKYLVFGLVYFAASFVPGMLLELLAILGVGSVARHHGVLADVGIVLGGVALVVGLFWLLLPFYFGPFELALDDDCGPIEVVRRIFILTRGKRWATLGMGLMCYLGTLVASLLTCGIGALFAVPLGAAVFGGVFLTFRNGSGLPPPVRRGRRAEDDALPAPAAPIPATPVVEPPPEVPPT